MKYDLSNLYIDFEKCPKGVRLSEHFSSLKPYKEFTECPDDNYIRLAILTGDIESPLAVINERRVQIEAAFGIIGVPIKGNEELFESVVDYSNFYYMSVLLKYLYVQNEVIFTDWVLVNRDYEYWLGLSNSPREKDMSDASYLKHRKSIRETISSLGEEKKKLEAKLFPDSRAAREASIQEAKSKIETWAERYAEAFNYY